jgi:hypothetical protein
LAAAFTASQPRRSARPAPPAARRSDDDDDVPDFINEKLQNPPLLPGETQIEFERID